MLPRIMAGNIECSPSPRYHDYREPVQILVRPSTWLFLQSLSLRKQAMPCLQARLNPLLYLTWPLASVPAFKPPTPGNKHSLLQHSRQGFPTVADCGTERLLLACSQKVNVEVKTKLELWNHDPVICRGSGLSNKTVDTARRVYREAGTNCPEMTGNEY